MQLLLVSLCLALCCLTLVSATDPHYVITAPAEIRQGFQEKACVVFQDLDGDVHLKLELQKDDQVHVIAEQDISSHDFFHCYPLGVPALKEQEADWFFYVSAQGEHLKITDKRKIHFLKSQDMCVIQTDKKNYKPGDIVRFRVLSIDQHFHALNKKYETIFIKDDDDNHIAQWLDVTPDHGFADFTFHLSKELRLGTYLISVNDECLGNFYVDEYDLKRFKLILNVPSDVVYTDKSFNLEVCASYSHGKPVQGTLDIEVCNIPVSSYAFDYYEDEGGEEFENSMICIKTRETKTDSKGCLSKEINLQNFNINQSHRDLQISVNLTEDGTGHTEKKKAYLYFLKKQKIKLLADSVYHRGHPFTGKILVVNCKKPVAVVITSLNHHDEVKTLKIVETNSDGLAHFTLDTDSWKGSFPIEARLQSEAGDISEEDMETFLLSESVIWLYPYYSESNSLLKIETKPDDLLCDSDVSLKVDYHISKDQLDSKTDHMSFFYVVRSGIGFHSHKEYKMDVTKQSTLQGSFSIKIQVDGDLSPNFSVLVYTILPKGETLSDQSKYKVSSCFKNKVQLKFSKDEVFPGEKVNLEVIAEPGSMCSVRSVDKGYLFRFPYEEDYSFAEDVIDSVPRAVHNPRKTYDRAEESTQCPENQTVFKDRDLQDTQDSASMFQKTNLNIITNTRIKLPVKCVEEEVSARSSTLKKKFPKLKAKRGKRKHPTRRNFPDIWMFGLVSIGPEGHTTLNSTTPDSITKWQTEAFCLGKSGIGEIRNVELVAFQPYFIDLISPYSVVQGETFQIEAQVFSYEKQCILVVVSLFEEDGIQTVQSKEQARCVCDGQATYFSWDATASKIGNIKIRVDSGSLKVEGGCVENVLLISEEHREDSVEKSIVIKARGHKAQTAQTHLLCNSEHRTENVTFTLKTPPKLVPGSEYAHIVAIGDIMGNPIINLESILTLPDGCAEQSISKFSRYVSALEYLESMNKLIPETKEKLLKALIEGYQKQLTFKQGNGSYGFFFHDSESSVWITSLVVKGLNSARRFIYIDEKNILDSVSWLENQQSLDGCFNEDNAFNGLNYFMCTDFARPPTVWMPVLSYFEEKDKENKILQTAVILNSLLEHPINYNGSIVEKAIFCIRKGAEDVTKPISFAVLAYTFTLLGDTKLRALMLKQLNEHAHKDERGVEYWKGSCSHVEDIETSAYAILALLSGKITTHKELDECAHIVRWLVKQQNPQGGFSSSQDSTIALQALAKYGRAISHMEGESTVTIDGESGFQKEIHVDKRNNLLLQTVDLPKASGDYTASIKGNGCVYIQSHLHYNLFPEEHNIHFSVRVTTEPAVCSHGAQTTFDVHMDARYLGKQLEILMAVIKVELLSGHVPCKKSVTNLMNHPIVKKVDVSLEHIEIYLLEVTHETQSFVFTLNKETHVDNLHPANIIIYDYYNPVVSAYVEYNAPCNSGPKAEVQDSTEVQQAQEAHK